MLDNHKLKLKDHAKIKITGTNVHRWIYGRF